MALGDIAQKITEIHVKCHARQVAPGPVLQQLQTERITFCNHGYSDLCRKDFVHCTCYRVMELGLTVFEKIATEDKLVA